MGIGLERCCILLSVMDLYGPSRSDWTVRLVPAGVWFWTGETKPKKSRGSRGRNEVGYVCIPVYIRVKGNSQRQRIEEVCSCGLGSSSRLELGPNLIYVMFSERSKYAVLLNFPNASSFPHSFSKGGKWVFTALWLPSVKSNPAGATSVP